MDKLPKKNELKSEDLVTSYINYLRRTTNSLDTLFLSVKLIFLIK